MSSTAAISIGVLAGSFMFVAAFAFIITRIARAKHRERMIKGQAFAYIKSEESRFQGIIKRVSVQNRRPTVAQIFELQDYYNSKECGSSCFCGGQGSAEPEFIELTFKNMQLLGYDVKLFKTDPKDGSTKEVDLSHVHVKPCKEVKNEMKRHK